MNRTDQTTALERITQIADILERINDGCLGDAEYCELQHQLLELDPGSTQLPADAKDDSDLEPPY